MADIVNLRNVRKRAARRQEELDAEAHRLAHDRPAHERRRDATEREKSDRILDQHQIEKGDER